MLDHKIYGYELSMRAERYYCLTEVKSCFSFKFERVGFHFSGKNPTHVNYNGKNLPKGKRDISLDFDTLFSFILN